MFEGALAPGMLSVIGRLTEDPYSTRGFRLAGGTALALHFGHRRSVDLDFFSTEPFVEENVVGGLLAAGGTIVAREERTVHALVESVKCSFFGYPYRWISSGIPFHGIELAGVPDIAAMKVVAIAQRGTKKDFFDLYEILRGISIQEETWCQHRICQYPKCARMARLRRVLLEKYGDRRVNCYHVVRSLVFFEEAEGEPDPVSLNGTTWEEVKSFFLSRERSHFSDLVC